MLWWGSHGQRNMLLCWQMQLGGAGLCSQLLQWPVGRVCSCILAEDCEMLHQNAELSHFLAHHCGMMR